MMVGVFEKGWPPATVWPGAPGEVGGLLMWWKLDASWKDGVGYGRRLAPYPRALWRKADASI